MPDRLSLLDDACERFEELAARVLQLEDELARKQGVSANIQEGTALLALHEAVQQRLSTAFRASGSVTESSICAVAISDARVVDANHSWRSSFEHSLQPVMDLFACWWAVVLPYFKAAHGAGRSRVQWPGQPTPAIQQAAVIAPPEDPHLYEEYDQVLALFQRRIKSAHIKFRVQFFSGRWVWLTAFVSLASTGTRSGDVGVSLPDGSIDWKHPLIYVSPTHETALTEDEQIALEARQSSQIMVEYGRWRTFSRVGGASLSSSEALTTPRAE